MRNISSNHVTPDSSFKPRHINATRADLEGNNGIGRYILLPGSDGRAKQISTHFENCNSQPHPRSHNLLLGTIPCDGKNIDVATVSSGMGCPSMEIILHELYQLGGKRFLRVGTAGSLQPKMVKIGDIINTVASVRDESSTSDYMPLSIPAIASIKMTSAINAAAEKLNLINKIHSGTVHCKATFYAREFGAGPKADENNAYLDLISRCGILASEMETAALFIQSQLYNYEMMCQGRGPTYEVLWGAILGVVAIPPDEFATPDVEAETVKNMTALAMETIRVLWRNEQQLLK